MLKNEEISEKLAEYLVNGGKNLSTFYHLLKTHKISQDVENPGEWLVGGHLLRDCLDLLTFSCNLG